MAIETELKLRIAPEQLVKLKRNALLKAHAVTRPVTRRLYNIYYDTPKLELHRSEMALRLRHAGRQWLQTLKGGGSVKGGLHQRNEWEVQVRGPALDFSLPEMEEWDIHLGPSLRKKLRPVFVTDFSRNSRMLHWQGAQIELCMDQGKISTEQDCVALCELELELKSGEPQKLFELALAFLEIVPFELEAVSKAEQGYRLLSGYIEHPVKGVTPTLRRADTLADALRALIWACLQHFQANLPGAMSTDDAEYLHQMRVALRRLRVVLRMAERACADRELAVLRKDISDLAAALGPVREWDVFIAETLQPMCQRMTGHDGLQVLLAVSERKRASCYAGLRSEVQARELQRMLLRFAIWMTDADWLSADGSQKAKTTQPVQDFATRSLNKLAERFTRSARQMSTFEAGQLHALRILAKKLRYSTEFFASLYDKQKAKSFLAALSEVQEVLGRINDVASAHRLLDELAADTALSGDQECVALAKGWIAHHLSGLLTALRRSVRNFNEQPAFWNK